MSAINKTATRVLGVLSGTEGHKAEFRLILERRKVLAELASEEWLPLDELAEGWQELGSPSEDTLRETEYSHRDALHRRLLTVNQALERLNVGTYGICDRCREAIDPRRLEADPASLLCLDCQAFLEGDF